MPNITLSIPNDIYRKMKKYSEIKWSEVARKAIVDYLNRLEEGKTEFTTEEILKKLGKNFKKSLDELEPDKAIEGYRKMCDTEWRRLSTIRTN